jgi:hypothetical protein
MGLGKTEAIMRKLVWISLIAIFATAVTTVWAGSPVFTKRAPALAATADGISPEALMRQIDLKSLPVQEGFDLF